MKNNIIYDLILITPASLMLLLPSGIEESMNIKVGGYDMFSILLLGVIVLFFRVASCNTLSKEKSLLALLVIALIFDIRFISEDYFGHFAIGTEFFLGYIFAKNIKYTPEVLKVLYYVVLALLLLIIVQQISFTFELGLFTSGQEEKELVDGLLRSGTTAGSSTFTGIVVVVLAGILIVLSKSQLMRFLILLLAIFSTILSGTRSSMIVILVIGGYMLLKQKNVSKFYKIIAIVIFFYALLPSFERVLDSRNEVSLEVSDITSGRTERWENTFKYMNQDDIRYIIGNGGGTVPISNYNKHIKPIVSPHNAFIGVLFQYGLLALLVFLIFISNKFKKLWGHYSEGFVCLLFSLMVSFNSEVVTLSFLYSFFFWLLYFVEINTNKSYLKQMRLRKNFCI